MIPSKGAVSRKAILDIQGLRVQFFLSEGTVTALDGIDFTIYEKETVGIVGETGCGKSMTAFSILGSCQARVRSPQARSNSKVTSF